MGRNGALISMAAAELPAYAMAPLKALGVLFLHAQTQGFSRFVPKVSPSLTLSPINPVYPGMVIGESVPNPLHQETPQQHTSRRGG